MNFLGALVILCAFVQVLCIRYDDFADRDFDDDQPILRFHSDPELRSFENIVMREMAEDEPHMFNEKEKRVRNALLRSTHDTRNQRTFSEMWPILRSLSKQQRLTLAALISAQTNIESGKSLDLKQVEEMFGERRNLILPIIFDIANIVKKSSDGNENDNDNNHNEIPSKSRDQSDQFEGRMTNQRAKRSTIRQIDDRLSYHERKLNMTDFRGSPETKDQHAIESETRIHVSLPNSNTSTLLSVEQIENLALSDLNGTNANIENGNQTIAEILPEPEMLIKPYRVRPTRISESFDNIYLYVADYPIRKIMGSIGRHRYAMTALLADNPNGWRSHMEELEAKKRREDEDNSIPSSGMCPSIVRYARPQKARSASGEWKYIVNTGQHTQTLRLEKCTHPEHSCTYLTDNFNSRCAQIYNYHRLLSWDHTRGLHIDIFKVPTCCSCQIDGYREKFPPVSSYSENDHELYESRFSASDAIYPLANPDYNDNDSEDSPSEPTGAIYTPIPSQTKKSRHEKRKKNKRPVSNLDSYLTPPSPTKNSEPDTFKRKQSSAITSNRINSHSILIGNDEIVESHTERPNRYSSQTINLPPPIGQPPRLTPSKVLIKRVNYNYHPIIDFFFRDRNVKNAKTKRESTQP